MSEISKSQMAKLFYRLEKAYSAGLDLRTVLERESKSGPGSYRNAIGQVSDSVNQGNSLANAISSLDGYFPPLVISIVKAGERGGRLEEAFRKLSRHYDGLVKFRSRLLAGIAWPLFELGMGLTVFGALILILGYLLDSEEMAIDWFGLGLDATGNFILYVCLVFFFGSVAFALLFGSLKGWFGTMPMRIAKRIPVLGKTIEALSLSRLAWTMSIAENAGMRAEEIVELSMNATQNFYFTNLIDDLTADVKSGLSFTEAFRSTDVFPEDFLVLVENGETAGELAETMERASNDLQETAEANLKIISTVCFVLTFLFVAALIGFIIISIMSKYLGILDSVQKSF
ncbi:MAG: type II secretion system F family protein [Pirellulaceae bacterium]